MTLSRRAWNDYIAKLSRCNEEAAQAMHDYLAAHGVKDAQGIIEYAFAVATKYGEASAALAAEMYDATAALASVHVPPAVPAETASYREIEAAMTSVAAYENPKTISNTVSRFVKQAGADTTVQNALRDGAEWAWVPNGGTCAFCLALASRGWQPASKKALKGNHAQHIHANCDCAYAIRFDSETELRGYDPEKYQEIYYGAEGKNSTARINYIRRQNYKANREEINAQKRAAYAERKAREAGQKALVKAEKNGIIKPSELLFAEGQKQFGKKVGKHAADFGLKPYSETDREKLKNMITDIVDSAEEKRAGTWRGQKNDVIFYIKDGNVVVTKENGEFITILEGGSDNARVKNAGK